jgi:predicted O-linked N-acetylglucosamine transferase (SPINDLY family)
VPFLLAGVLEHHDRSKFETYGVSLGPNDRSAMRARLENAFTHFLDVPNLPDAEIAGLLRVHEIDIAIDLNGYTAGARPGILGRRAAPVQVNYLGYPGTMGADAIDYIIADRVLIPPEHRQFYSEQVVWLPDTYQANDSSRVLLSPPSRAEMGLPEDTFVFCCFNANHKILPDSFGRWMTILRGTANTVLWLLEDNAAAAANLRIAAQAHGVAPERLVFAAHERPDRHLARIALADLVLDSLPYGAHTTSSDALWAGVPVLTLLGATFAGRVAASLLSAIGIPELITQSAEEYQTLACELAQNRDFYATFRSRLARNRETMPLFDTNRMTRNLEAAYTIMWERHQRGEFPAHFAA